MKEKKEQKRCEVCEEIIDRDWEEENGNYCENDKLCFFCWEGSGKGGIR